MIETFTENGELYGQFFLYNNKMNNAGDPINFQVHADNNDKIARSFIGRPYLIPQKDKKGNWFTKHFRTEKAEDIFNLQKKYAIGEIVRTPYNEQTGNYNAIVKFFPEHYDRVRKGDIPEFTSPMFAHTDSHYDEEGRLHIKDGMGVHLHGVPKGGYPPEISGIKSICEGGLNECMNELKIVAAAGQLAEYQTDERFSKEENEKPESNMSMQQPAQAPPAAPQQQDGDLAARVAAIEKVLQELIAKISGAAPQQAAPQVGAAEGVAVTESVQKDAEEQSTIKQELEAIKAEREAEKLELQKERESLALQERTRTATEIVENKIKLHRLSIESKDAEIKKLVDMKTANDQPADLTLLHAEIKESLKQLVGASGNYAELTFGEEHVDQEINHISAMEEIV